MQPIADIAARLGLTEISNLRHYTAESASRHWSGFR
jgi:hypothetical protein